LDLRLTDLTTAFAARLDARARLEDLPLAQLAALVALFLLTLLGAPLVVVTWRARKHTGAGTPAILREFHYFAVLGLAFMLVEVALVQQLTRLVGLPGESLLVVLGGLLVGTGLGSALWGKTRGATASYAITAAVATALVGALVVPHYVGLAESWPRAVRMVWALVFVVLAGAGLGGGFSLGLRAVRNPAAVGLAWASNGLGTVAGTLGGLMLGSGIGLRGTCLVAAALYGTLLMGTSQRVERTVVQ
jgi:hypothetical protein